MEKNPIEIGRLLAKFFGGTIDPQEELLLKDLIAQDPEVKDLYEQYLSTDLIEKENDYLHSLNSQLAWEKVQNKRKNRLKINARVLGIRWFDLVAACTAIFILFSTLNSQKSTRIIEDKLFGYQNDVLPGQEQAELILSNGRVVKLNDGKHEMNDAEGTVLNADNGMLTYQAASSGNIGSVEKILNTIKVPKSGTYQVTLSDGTKIKLNAMSSLTYPVRFNGDSREVTLEGEAYFDVSHSSSESFKVQTRQGLVTVMGTEFNVNTYTENLSYVTLVNGSVKVADQKNTQTIKPGEQATLGAPDIKIQTVDLEKFVAWNGGYFYFSEDKIEVIMDQLARWYGVDIKYVGGSSLRTYGGSIARTATLAEALEQLKKVGKFDFKIEQNKVTVNSNYSTK